MQFLIRQGALLMSLFILLLAEGIILHIVLPRGAK